MTSTEEEMGPLERVGIGDIAAAAGVSVATVSRVLNGRVDVAPQTRTRVLTEIRRRRYASNRTPHPRRAERTGLIGVMIPEVTGGYFSEFVAGIVEALEERELHPVISATHQDAEREREVLGRLSGGVTDGAILVMPVASVPQLPPLYHQGYLHVVLDPAVPVHETTPVVMASHRMGARVATDHLLARGHRRIGVVTGQPAGLSSIERLAGYREALDTAGVAFDEALVHRGDYLFDGGWAAANELLATSARPTAIFAFNDAMAAGVVRAAAENGIAVPGSLAVVGFDDAELARYGTPPLTSVRQPLRDMGRSAVRLLCDLLDERVVEARRLMLDTRHVVRASTDWTCLNDR